MAPGETGDPATLAHRRQQIGQRRRRRNRGIGRAQ
jgi:hypothetical protein